MPKIWFNRLVIACYIVLCFYSHVFAFDCNTLFSKDCINVITSKKDSLENNISALYDFLEDYNTQSINSSKYSFIDFKKVIESSGEIYVPCILPFGANRKSVVVRLYQDITQYNVYQTIMVPNKKRLQSDLNKRSSYSFDIIKDWSDSIPLKINQEKIKKIYKENKDISLLHIGVADKNIEIQYNLKQFKISTENNDIGRSIEEMIISPELIDLLRDEIIDNNPILLSATNLNIEKLAILINNLLPKKEILVSRNDIYLALSNLKKITPTIIDGKPNISVIFVEETLNEIQKRMLSKHLDNKIEEIRKSSFNETETTNIVLIAGHLDEELLKHLLKAGESNLLRDKFLILQTCEKPGEKDGIPKEKLKRYGISGLFTYQQEVNPETISKIINKINEKKHDIQNPFLLIKDAIENVNSGLNYLFELSKFNEKKGESYA